MNVSPAKHSYAWLPHNTHRRTDWRWTKWSLCAAMLRRRHKNYVIRRPFYCFRGQNMWSAIQRWWNLQSCSYHERWLILLELHCTHTLHCTYLNTKFTFYMYLLEQCVFSVDTVSDESGHHKTVNSDDTSHNNGNDGLHDQLGSHHRHGCNTRTGLGRAIGSSQCWNRGR